MIFHRTPARSNASVTLQAQSRPMNEKQRQRAVISLWMNRPAVLRTRGYVLEFHNELRRNNPELLGEGSESDSYKRLLTDLKKYLAN